MLDFPVDVLGNLDVELGRRIKSRGLSFHVFLNPFLVVQRFGSAKHTWRFNPLSWLVLNKARICRRIH